MAVGNVMEACATLLVKGRAWGELCSIMCYLARHDSGGLSRVVAGRTLGGASGQMPPPRVQPPLVAWPGLSGLPPLGTLPLLVVRPGLPLRWAPVARLGPPPGSRLSREDMSASRVLGVRVRVPRVPRAGEPRLDDPPRVST